MVFGDGSFGRQLGLDEVTKMCPHDGISAILGRNITELSLSLSPPCKETARK
jgi:hypothetical protein